MNRNKTGEADRMNLEVDFKDEVIHIINRRKNYVRVINE